MSVSVYVGGWQTLTGMHIYVSGAWQEVTGGWVYDGTAWQKFWPVDPVIDACSAAVGGFPNNTDVIISFDTGDNCESVAVELFNSSDVSQGVHYLETNPNTTGYSTTWAFRPGGLYYGVVTPYNQGSQGGSAGTPCTTGTVLVR